jgi:bacterioferritin
MGGKQLKPGAGLSLAAGPAPGCLRHAWKLISPWRAPFGGYHSGDWRQADAARRRSSLSGAVRRGAAERNIQTMKNKSISRKKLVSLLNEDLAREYQAIIAYIVYSQTMKGAQYLHIAGELEKHAAQELSHALLIAKQIDYLNGTPVLAPKEVRFSDKSPANLRFDLENERLTILSFRQRIRQAEELGEFGLSEVLRRIIAEEQDHLTDLADALGIDNPNLEE